MKHVACRHKVKHVQRSEKYVSGESEEQQGAQHGWSGVRQKERYEIREVMGRHIIWDLVSPYKDFGLLF